jgi:hypothetical protein
MRGSVAKVLSKVAAEMNFDHKARKEQKRLWNMLPWNKRHLARLRLEALAAGK